MSNEEMILESLSQVQSNQLQMQANMAQMQTNMAQMLTSITQMQDNMAQMRSDLTEVKLRTTTIEVTLENKVMPYLQTLAEGHETLLQTLAPKNRVEALEEEVTVLRMAVKSLAQEVAELKQAQ